MLDFHDLSLKVFDNLLPEGKTHGQGVLNCFRGLLNTATNSLLRCFTFDIQGFSSLSRSSRFYKSEQFNSSKSALGCIFVPWCSDKPLLISL